MSWRNWCRLTAWGGALLLSSGCVTRRAGKPEAAASAAVSSLPTAIAPAEPRAEPALVWGSVKAPFASDNAQCVQLRSETEQRLRAVRDPFEGASPDDSKARLAAFRSQIAEHSACVPSAGARGVWAIVFEGGPDPRGWSWLLEHIDARGTRTQHAGNFPQQIAENAKPSSYSGKADFFDAQTYRGPVGIQIVSDYDGDGEPEVVVWTAELGAEVRSWARGLLWSFTNGALSPYAKSETLGVAPFDRDFALGGETAPLKDVDGDGRIDLLGYGAFSGVYRKTCGVVEAFEALGPRLVVHSRPDGSFASADSAVVASAKQSCPSPPAHVFVVDRAGHVDERATFIQLACARLWGVSSAQLEQEKQRVCGRDAAVAAGDCQTERACSLELLLVYADWSRKKTPFSLR